MKKEFLKIAKELGFELRTIRYERLEFSSVGYFITIYKDDKYITEWDGGYFIGEVGTGNSKESVLPDFEQFLKKLQIKP